MITPPSRVFLDTNVYIIGSSDARSPEAHILQWAHWLKDSTTPFEVVVSEDLFNEVLRVAKRLRNKDWAGQIVSRIWKNLNLHYVLVDSAEIDQIAHLNLVPSEDIEVYLTARNGKADCFVSANHELIRSLVQKTGEFECLTPAEFVTQYLR